jgi:hypothetical protein
LIQITISQLVQIQLQLSLASFASGSAYSNLSTTNPLPCGGPSGSLGG